MKKKTILVYVELKLNNSVTQYPQQEKGFN